MARQSRFVLPGQAHLVVQRGHNGGVIAHDEADRRLWLELLRDVAVTQRVAVHGWSIFDTGIRLLVTPPTAQALSRMMQDLGRRYVGAFNARHRRSGTLWDGRFRCAAVDAGAWELLALAYVEYEAGTDITQSSRAHHVGQSPEPLIADPAAYWALGNTPFERHLAWSRQLETPIPAAQVAAIEAALRRGTPLAAPQTLHRLQQSAARVLMPRPRGRPRKPR
jgi:putative transposase